MKYKTLIPLVVSILFIMLFVYAAVSKLMEMNKFQVQLGQSPLLTEYAIPVSWLVPVTELIIALGLSIDRFRYCSLFASFGLMILFSGYIFIITRFSEFVPCSCGGILEKMSWDQHLLFNILFVILALTAIIVYDLPDKRSLLQHNQEYAEHL